MMVLQGLLRFCEGSVMGLWGVCDGYWGSMRNLWGVCGGRVHNGYWCSARVCEGSAKCPQDVYKGSMMGLWWLLRFPKGSTMVSWWFCKDYWDSMRVLQWFCERSVMVIEVIIMSFWRFTTLMHLSQIVKNTYITPPSSKTSWITD